MATMATMASSIIGPSPLLLAFFIFSNVVVSSKVAALNPDSQAQALLNFKDSLKNNSKLSSWNSSISPCSLDVSKPNWVGVLCTAKGTIWALQLENMGLNGSPDMTMLTGLKELRSISLMNNSFDGSWPDIRKLSALKTLYLSYNKFQGEIPGDTFTEMKYLKKLHLAENQFRGEIPRSLLDLHRLLELRLEGNRFTGAIPKFDGSILTSFNVSNNALQGEVPQGLSKMNVSAFTGNEGLCGGLLSKSCNEERRPADPPSKKLSVAIMVIISISSVVIVFSITAGTLICNRQKKTIPISIEASPQTLGTKPASGHKSSADQPSAAGRISPHDSDGCDAASDKKSDNGKVSFVRDDRERFDLPDLMRASAEVMGSGCFGASYKAALPSGAAMVVKRYKQMNNVSKEEFHEHMQRVGRLRNNNLLPLVAFYYKNDDKLLISDFVQRGSLSVHLHGRKERLGWPTRLKIVKGIARGLQYLYKELPSLIAPHGHLKSSNVLLNESFEPFLADYALIPVVNKGEAQNLLVAYKSPEYLHNGRITKKTDVWSLGLLILEIVTGKIPAMFRQQGRATDEEGLASWVNSIPEEKWMILVFDKEMGGIKNCEREIVKLLKIAMACCEADVEKRSGFREAVEGIEELKEREHGEDDFYSSYAMTSDF